MNQYGALIDKLIYIKDSNPLTRLETEAINEACNVLALEGKKERVTMDAK